ncbi:rhodanese-like domain-containing protein [uncultured Imperialibacter sp.]|uniref:rhodanese-like domain-containing protein n=1 Tax=uncultured Imperialibacter sp. TaxID=1672639 RepID=UPI0030DBF63C|tara:strand:- start:885 stop:1487 length:603 start_codon:yes stop_codon:yes gene_type:complete
MKQLTFNQKLAAMAFLLAVASLVVALAFPNGPKSVSQEPRFVSVVTLAERIKNREPLVLIDLREPDLFEEFHLPTAVNMSLNEIQETGLAEGTTYVFYSGDDLLTRHLWISLPPAIKKQSSILYGGVHDWYNHLLYPTLPLEIRGEDSLMAEKVEALTRFYGGQAEFEKDSTGLAYYTKDMGKASWPVVKRVGKLMRKGC